MPIVNSKEVDAIMADARAFKVLYPNHHMSKLTFCTPGRSQNDINLAWLLLQIEGVVPKNEPTWPSDQR